MRKFYYILLAFTTLCIMASCELEPSSDGSLYGFWHLESIDSIEEPDRMFRPLQCPLACHLPL